MKDLFDKFEFNSANCESWHIRKKILVNAHYDNQMLQFYDYGEVRCGRSGEEPLCNSGATETWGLYFFVSGSCRCRKGKEILLLRKYDILLLEPDKSYSFEVTGKQKLHVRKLFFMDTPAARFLLTVLLQEGFMHISDPDELTVIFNNMEKILTTSSKMNLRDLSISIYSLLAEISRQCPDSESFLTIHSVVSEVECAPWNNYNVPELAKKCGLSARSFQRQFKSFTGHSFLTYLTNCKIHLACRLLQNKKYALKEIIKICNFRSHPYFYRLFKSVTGVSPGAYRSNLSGDKYFETGVRDIKNQPPSPEDLTPTRKNIIWHIWGNRHISITCLASILSLHRSVVQKNIQYLKKHGYLLRNGSARAGFWSIAEKYKSFFSGYTPEKLSRLTQKNTK